MKAMVLTRHGGLDALDYQENHPTPQPKTGEVLIKVGACGVNNTDINTRTGWYSPNVTSALTTSGGTIGFKEAGAEGGWGEAITFPRIQGADIAGQIVGLGKGVAAHRLGERVLVDVWLLDKDDPLSLDKARFVGSEINGGYGEYVAIPQENAYKIDSELSDVELASFPCAYVTAENLLSKVDLKEGEVVVISGASGGVGTAAIQLAKNRGSFVIAIASKAKENALLNIGANCVIDRNEENLEEAIGKVAPNGEVDTAIDVVGGEMFKHLIASLKVGGRYATSGAIAGPIATFDLRHLIYKDLKLYGATVVPSGIFKRLVSYIENGKLTPLVHEVYSLEEAREAQAAFLQKQHIGNIVLKVS